jgi:anti-sigma B factor antagonist
MTLRSECPPRAKDAPRDLLVIRFTGGKVSLHEEALQNIRDSLLACADEPGRSDLYLDFGNVAFLGSAALGTLVTLHKKLAADGLHLAVGNLRRQVREVFTVTHLDRLLDLRPVGRGAWRAPRVREYWIESI